MTGEASPGDVYLLPDGSRVAVIRKAKTWKPWSPWFVCTFENGDEYAAKPDPSWVLDVQASWANRAGFTWREPEPEAS